MIRWLLPPADIASPALRLLLCIGAATLATPADAAPASRPLHLITDVVGTNIRLRVIGDSKSACDAAYMLEVTSTSASGRSRSVQRGTARLRAGVATTVATSTLARAGPTTWAARLTADACGSAARYEETASAPLPRKP